jgi:hypothetical protein
LADEFLAAPPIFASNCSAKCALRWVFVQEVMQRGAEEIGKMLNKGFDRQRVPTGGQLPSMMAGDADGVADEEGDELEGLHQGPLKGQQASAGKAVDEHGSSAAKPWMTEADADAEGEMN